MATLRVLLFLLLGLDCVAGEAVCEESILVEPSFLLANPEFQTPMPGGIKPHIVVAQQNEDGVDCLRFAEDNSSDYLRVAIRHVDVVETETSVIQAAQSIGKRITPENPWLVVYLRENESWSYTKCPLQSLPAPIKALIVYAGRCHTVGIRAPNWDRSTLANVKPINRLRHVVRSVGKTIQLCGSNSCDIFLNNAGASWTSQVQAGSLVAGTLEPALIRKASLSGPEVDLMLIEGASHSEIWRGPVGMSTRGALSPSPSGSQVAILQNGMISVTQWTPSHWTNERRLAVTDCIGVAWSRDGKSLICLRPKQWTLWSVENDREVLKTTTEVERLVPVSPADYTGAVGLKRQPWGKSLVMVDDSLTEREIPVYGVAAIHSPKEIAIDETGRRIAISCDFEGVLSTTSVVHIIHIESGQHVADCVNRKEHLKHIRWVDRTLIGVGSAGTVMQWSHLEDSP